MTRLGAARRGVAGQGKGCFQRRAGNRSPVQIVSMLGMARQGAARRGSARRGVAGHGLAGQGLFSAERVRSFRCKPQTWRIKMKTYAVEIIGKTPLLMHHDNIEWADYMDTWKNDPGNKKTSKAGDDRSPAWRWLGCCYHDGKRLAIPQANIMRAIMEGGAMVPVPGGKMGKTFKSQTQSGMMCVETFWTLETAEGRVIEWPTLAELNRIDSFPEMREKVRELGFDLLIKRAKIGTSKHIRVRPEFSAGWRISGHISVWDEQITGDALASILEYSGQYKGLCDWRPGGRTPGPFGTFSATIKGS